ncbi:MAG TPA: hypothetical protein VFH07_13360 [Chitinophagaceae bacterium]|nr:hypothetical protein [Chitinophagaceae bacterium]
MKLFTRHRNFFYAVKLFKITDQQSAFTFPIDKLFLDTIEYVEKLSGLKSSGFHLNYTKDYQSLKGFKSALSSLSEIVYGYVGFGKDDRKCFLAIDNAMLNYESKPRNSSIDLFLQLSELYHKPKSVIKICEDLIKKFDFEYGYIQGFPDNFNGTTERKVKGLFSRGVEITELDHIWTFHSVGLRYGYLKNLYNINFINKSHFESPELSEVIKKFGDKQAISPDITIWTISNEEIDVLKTLPDVKRRLIQIEKPKNEFLKSVDSKEFYSWMKLQHMKASR